MQLLKDKSISARDGKEKKGRPHLLLVRIKTAIAIVEISVDNFQKAQSKSVIWSSYMTIWHRHKSIQILFCIYLIIHIH